MIQFLDFEKPLVELEERIQRLRAVAGSDSAQLADELRRLEDRAKKLQRELFEDLSAWQKVQLCRHPRRPYTLDYLDRLFTDFVELHGDRQFGEDRAIVGGLARFDGRSVVVIGHQKGRSTKENRERNFGMPHPEGYRKAHRLMELAGRFRLPILTFVDTPGAYPGIGAEERGQAEAIARNLRLMSTLGVPIVTTVLGEGGSGGALALAVSNRVSMLEYAIYSVISPEGCASILWKDQAKANVAAAELKLTAADLLRFGVIDAIIEEPAGGAHRDYDGAAERVGRSVRAMLEGLSALSPDALRQDRYDRFRRLGAFVAE